MNEEKEEKKEQEEEKKERENNKKKKERGWMGWIFIALIFLGFFSLVDFLILHKFTFKIWKYDWNWGWTAFWLQILYVILSFKQIGPRDTGVLLFFGRPILSVGSGLVFAPLGIIKLETITRIVREKEYPDPEKTYKGKGDVPNGKIPPIRVIQGQKEIEAGKKEEDPLDKRLTTEISIIIRYRVTNFMTFIGTIGSIEELDRTIEDVLVATLRKELAIISPAQTLKEWRKIEETLHEEVKDLVKDWGVEVQTTRLKEVDIGHGVNTALMDIIESALKKKSIVINAEAESEKRTLEGVGLAKAKQVLLEAEAVGYKKIAAELGLKESELVLFAETVKTLTEKSQYTLLTGSGGIADLFGVIGAIKNILPKIQEKEA